MIESADFPKTKSNWKVVFLLRKFIFKYHLVALACSSQCTAPLYHGCGQPFSSILPFFILTQCVISDMDNWTQVTPINLSSFETDADVPHWSAICPVPDKINLCTYVRSHFNTLRYFTVRFLSLLGWHKIYPHEKQFEASDLLNKLVKEGKLGKKTGHGFYSYSWSYFMLNLNQVPCDKLLNFLPYCFLAISCHCSYLTFALALTLRSLQVIKQNWCQDHFFFLVISLSLIMKMNL